MDIQIRVKGLPRAAKLRVFAAHKLQVALARFSHVVQGVSLRMNDINGPDRGGADKLCRVVLRLKDNTFLVIEELGANMMEVIDRATNRLHQNLSRQLAKLAKTDRNGLRQANRLPLQDA